MNTAKTTERIMDYKVFEAIFNNAIFSDYKTTLIEKIAKSPHRYTGIFRPTRPEAKIIQNVSQSQEIRFGDAFETLIEKYLEENGFKMQPKRFDYDGKTWLADQLFTKGNTIFLVEQKVRDDHDSSKVPGQIGNFKKKSWGILEMHLGKKVECIIYFIDPSFHKAKNTYISELEKFSAECPKISFYLFYGEELFVHLGIPEVWEEINNYLKQWRKSIPMTPSINFDDDSEASFEEIKNIRPGIYRKLFSNDDLIDILQELFPKAKTLELLQEEFRKEYMESGNKKYNGLTELCQQTIDNIKSKTENT